MKGSRGEVIFPYVVTESASRGQFCVNSSLVVIDADGRQLSGSPHTRHCFGMSHQAVAFSFFIKPKIYCKSSELSSLHVHVVVRKGSLTLFSIFGRDKPGICVRGKCDKYLS